MLETEIQSNTSSGINTGFFKKRIRTLVILGLVLVLAILSVCFYQILKFNKLNNNQLKLVGKSNKLTGLKPGLYTMDGNPFNISDAQKQQNFEFKPAVLPDNFPKDYIPVKYEKLLSVAGIPNTENAPYGATFVVSGKATEKYEEVKKYFNNKNWQVTELNDRQIINDGKQLVAQYQNTVIITTVFAQDQETVVTLNIITQVNAK